jgi:two-component system cell cycle sensor histidine kinase/response regulator CckA
MADLLSSKPKSSPPELHSDLPALLRAQKTELISELTRSTANQFNNIMMAITSYAELEMKQASVSQRRSLEQVLSNANRATALVQKLLTLTRTQPGLPQPLDLNALLTGASDLVQQLTGDAISVAYELDPNGAEVEADPAEIEHLVLSLAVNARDAMPRGGKLTVSTKLVDFDKGSQDTGELERKGKYVMLSLDDSGPDHTAEHVVGSYDQDTRINLSLAAVRGIVNNANGWVRFSSEPGKGNSFKVYFPSSKGAGEDSKVSPPRSLPVACTILVVEDDDAVRIPTSEFLKMEGFKVLQARTGDEAVHVVQQSRSRLDILITDIVMPKMSGRQVAEKLSDLNPGLKILYMSGDTDESNRARASSLRGNALLRKPFRLETLKDRIHELLGE